MGGDEHNDIESRTRGVGYDNWAEAPGDNETWWWNDKVQKVIKVKKVANKIWDASRRQEDKDRYRQANKAAKKAVATTKALAINELYEELETPEGERKIFRLAKARDKATKDFSHMKQIKNEHGVVLIINETWI